MRRCRNHITPAIMQIAATPPTTPPTIAPTFVFFGTGGGGIGLDCPAGDTSVCAVLGEGVVDVLFGVRLGGAGVEPCNVVSVTDVGGVVVASAAPRSVILAGTAGGGDMV